ncbi:hypothetical protein JZ751_029867 [Albula glossodonta]|uniref:Uncharacterized protein n=1 Tax=Albula glossodonta TaxID=121402 RepID=A0A8T2MMT9_9TELE|nr:hypothetical protein JZ751_029867 [Albula glossodonta]
MVRQYYGPDNTTDPWLSGGPSACARQTATLSTVEPHPPNTTYRDKEEGRGRNGSGGIRKEDTYFQQSDAPEDCKPALGTQNHGQTFS